MPSKKTTTDKKKTVSKKRASSEGAERASFNVDDIREEIRKKAYEIHIKKGGSHDDEWLDWFRAEKIVSTGAGKHVIHCID